MTSCYDNKCCGRELLTDGDIILLYYSSLHDDYNNLEDTANAPHDHVYVLLHLNTELLRMSQGLLSSRGTNKCIYNVVHCV